MTDAQQAQEQEERQRFFNLLGEAVLGEIARRYPEAQPTTEELSAILKAFQQRPGQTFSGVYHLAAHFVELGLKALRSARARQRAVECLGQMEPYLLSGEEYAPLCLASILTIPAGPLEQSLLELSRQLGFAYGEVAQLLYTERDSVLPPVEVRPVVSCRVHRSLGYLQSLHEKTPTAHRFETQYEALCYAAEYAPKEPNGTTVLFPYPDGWVIVRRQEQNTTVFSPSRFHPDHLDLRADPYMTYVIMPGLNPD